MAPRKRRVSEKVETNTSLVACPACSLRVPEGRLYKHLAADCYRSETDASSSLSHPEIIDLISDDDGKSASSSAPSSPTPATRSAPRKRKNSAELSGKCDRISSYKRPKQEDNSAVEVTAPLADRLRPDTLDEFIGQVQVIGPNSPLFDENGEASTGNIIFWGPPGCGKTTLARLLARRADATFKELSATIAGVNEVRAVFNEARGVLQSNGRRTIVFIDEIHRFTRTQQDELIPYVERGYVQIIGATTENPSFELNRALLGLCRVYVLERLTDEDVVKIIERAVARVMSSSPRDKQDTPSGSASTQFESAEQPPPLFFAEPPSDVDGPSPADAPGPPQPRITKHIITSIAHLACGDARTALSLLELVLHASPETPEETLLDTLRHSVSTSYDRTGDSHYDCISALHKSVRGSQPGAAQYWLARMLAAGEDPVYVARRMTVCASEDIGVADQRALPLAVSTFQTCQTLGMPACGPHLAQLVAYLAEAPKSTRSYEGYKCAEALVKRGRGALPPVPVAMRDIPASRMDELGVGYRYPPDFMHPVPNEYLPQRLSGELILRKEGDLSDKIWDEEALRHWEEAENDGLYWEGRPNDEAL
ncbi:hypothetical protein BC834DRAFT_925966 [Gloeopeniophorella convolvens]|nr:hypothetical protein BC834DRAFT_925966 [Gloeopeniophorella convolvens]